MKRNFFLIFAILIGCSGGDEATEQQTAQQTDMMTEEVEYSAGGVTMNGFLAYDGSQEGQRPGVLVVHEWWGHNDYARERAKMLAELGYTALAVDMYGDGKQAAHPDDAMKFATEVMSNAEAARERFTTALELLKQHATTDPAKTAAIGYCFGGSVVLSMANTGADLDAVVSFHGGLQGIAPAQPGVNNAKVLVCNGAADQMVTQEQIDAFKKNMEAAAVDYEIVNYEGAMHSFTNPKADSFAAEFNLPLAYNAEADQQSWQKMQALFSSVFDESGY